MERLEIKLLNYNFVFRPLTWREEFGLDLTRKDRLREFLAIALIEVAGLPVNTVEDAKRVLDAVPYTVLERVLVIYKGRQPKARLFHAVGLYRAPEPKKFRRVFEEETVKRDEAMDQVEREMEAKFGRQELEDAKEVDRRILEASKLRGASKPSPDLPKK
jgi:hypothetical protein